MKNDASVQVHAMLSDLVSEGLTVADMARETGASTTTIRKYLKSAKSRTVQGKFVLAVRNLHDSVVVKGEGLQGVVRAQKKPRERAEDVISALAGQGYAFPWEKLTARQRARVRAEYDAYTSEISAMRARMKQRLTDIAGD